MCLCRYRTARGHSIASVAQRWHTRGALGRSAGLQHAWRWRGCCDASHTAQTAAMVAGSSCVRSSWTVGGAPAQDRAARPQ